MTEQMIDDNQQPAAVIILAAGAGTRMKSQTPKILHEIGGRSMLGHAIEAAIGVEPEKLAVTVRHQRDTVADHISQIHPEAHIVDQDEVPGTGRAVEVALDELGDDIEGTVVVTYGDVPLLTSEQLAELIEVHENARSSATVLTAILDDPSGYGRIIRDETGLVEAIVEHKDANEEERAVQEVNSGIYAFDASSLRSALKQVTSNNAQGEKYLTDVITIIHNAGNTVKALISDDPWQVEGANDRVQLSELGYELNRRLTEKWMKEGVTIVDPANTWIDVDVVLENDIIIYPGVQLYGKTQVGQGSRIGPDTTLENVQVGKNAQVIRTHGSDAVIGGGASVGPFAYLRPGTILGSDGKIGTFVETKNAQIGQGSKVPHLSYVGDATIGENSNIGAASVFVNYDGVNKHHTTIGNDVRMGSDNMYVAPVNVGDGAYSGAGSVIRKDVPSGALAISVAPQRNVEGWVEKNRPGSSAAQASAAANHASDSSAQKDTKESTGDSKKSVSSPKDS